MQAHIEQVAGFPPEPVFRLSVDQYHSMVRSGILDEDSRVELLEGWLVPGTSNNPPHVVSTRCIRDSLESLLPQEWHVRCEEPITLADSEPEPDLAVVRHGVRDYATRHPAAADIALVVEVADTTLERDRTTKKRVYARAAIPYYWLADVNARRVFVWSAPQPEAAEPDYGDLRIYPADEEIAVVLDGCEIGRIRTGTLF